MGGQGSSYDEGYGGSGAGGSGFKGRQTDEERRHSVEQEAANMGERCHEPCSGDGICGGTAGAGGGDASAVGWRPSQQRS